ncbi:MAG: protein kinase, partial [Polyangiaceae bacterium]
PVYMAPEQIFGDDDIDGRADVWSLGIVLYECLAGRRPTDGDGFGRIIRRITTDELEPLEHARPGLPHRLTSLVGRMLSRDRATRPSLVEVGAVLESLETREADAPPSAQPALVSAVGPARIATTASNVALEHASKRPPAAASRRVALAGIGAVLGTGAVLASVGFTVWRLRAGTPAAAARTASPVSGASSQEPTHLMMAALAALKDRDGVTCLRDLDAYDASPLRGEFPPSTEPAGGMGTRARCA